MALDKIVERVRFDSAALQKMLPGSLVTYRDEKDVSSRVTLASSAGVIRKEKRRKLSKALYELFALSVWHDVLRAYSEVNDLVFRAPRPIGLDIEGSPRGSSALLMDFLSGYKIKRFGNLKRTTPVYISGQNEPLTLYSACALHLGALNEIKEREGLYHSDFDGRHVLFSPVDTVSISVIDVEKSRVSRTEALRESKKIFDRFHLHTSSPRDSEAIRDWYGIGKSDLKSPEGRSPVDVAIEGIKTRYDVNFDMENRKINGQKVF